jgi:hypothetical protein
MNVEDMFAGLSPSEKAAVAAIDLEAAEVQKSVFDQAMADPLIAVVLRGIAGEAPQDVLRAMLESVFTIGFAGGRSFGLSVIMRRLAALERRKREAAASGPAADGDNKAESADEAA